MQAFNVRVTTPRTGLSVRLTDEDQQSLVEAFGGAPYFQVTAIELVNINGEDCRRVTFSVSKQRPSGQVAYRAYKSSQAKPSWRLQFRDEPIADQYTLAKPCNYYNTVLHVGQKTAVILMPPEFFVPSNRLGAPGIAQGSRPAAPNATVLMSVLGKEFSFSLPTEEAFELALKLTRKGYSEEVDAQ